MSGNTLGDNVVVLQIKNYQLFVPCNTLEHSKTSSYELGMVWCVEFGSLRVVSSISAQEPPGSLREVGCWVEGWFHLLSAG